MIMEESPEFVYFSSFLELCNDEENKTWPKQLRPDINTQHSAVNWFVESPDPIRQSCSKVSSSK